MKVRKILFMLAGVCLLASCSSLYEELLLKKSKVNVTSAVITEEGGTYTLTVTTPDDVKTTSTVSVNDTPATDAGSVTENADGTETLTYDVSDVIDSSTPGGTVPVTISAEGFEDTPFTADYIPNVTVTAPADKFIYNSQADSEAEPSATTNYHDSITVTKTYTASDGTVLSTWAEVKSFMADVANKGKTVTVTFTATADKDSTKTASAVTVYTIKADGAIDNVKVTGTAKTGETLTATTYYLDEDDNNAEKAYTGTDVTYQWYIADDSSGTNETAISGATGSTVKVPSSVGGNAITGKYIYVKAVQSTTSTTKQSTPVVITANTIASATATYTPNTAPATAYDVVSATLSGTVSLTSVTDSAGNNITDISSAVLVNTTGLTGSGNKGITVSAPGYTDYTSAEVFVTVQYAAPTGTNTLLSDSVSDITSGYIKFAAASSTLEYSADGGSTWNEITTAEFEKPTALYVRTKATGTAGVAGYIAPSEKVSVDMTGKVGTKVSVKVVTVTVDPFGDITVSKTENSSTITLTAATGYTNYAWDVDNAGSLASGFSASDNVLTITKAGLTKGTYRVTVSGTKNGIIYSTGISVVVE